jgi:hypothetical protein
LKNLNKKCWKPLKFWYFSSIFKCDKPLNEPHSICSSFITQFFSISPNDFLTNKFISISIPCCSHVCSFPLSHTKLTSIWNLIIQSAPTSAIEVEKLSCGAQWHNIVFLWETTIQQPQFWNRYADCRRWWVCKNFLFFCVNAFSSLLRGFLLILNFIFFWGWKSKEKKFLC